MRDILKEKESEAKTIEKALSQWRAMTISEAKRHGWTDKQDHLQARLWVLGYEINQLMHDIKKHLGGERE